MWQVLFTDEFAEEFRRLPKAVQTEFSSQANWIKRLGPQASRPRVDTLKGSKYANMKELRLEAGDGVWRFAFAFDPRRMAIVLVAGDKSGISEKRFYRSLIAAADDRFTRHLSRISKEGFHENT